MPADDEGHFLSPLVLPAFKLGRQFRRTPLPPLDIEQHDERAGRESVSDPLPFLREHGAILRARALAQLRHLAPREPRQAAQVIFNQRAQRLAPCLPHPDETQTHGRKG
jgi:hypothetical protein